MISNITRKTEIAFYIKVAEDPWSKMKGLLGRKDLSPDESLIIMGCQSIHTFFMKFPIDVIFCDNQNKVVGLCSDIKPFCLSPYFFRASYAIELPAGKIAASQTQMGDEINSVQYLDDDIRWLSPR